jgi:hypothetical protein
MIERRPARPARPARRAADEGGGAGRRWLDRTGTGLSGRPRTTSRAAWVHGIGAQNVGSGTASGGHADDQISVHIGGFVRTLDAGQLRFVTSWTACCRPAPTVARTRS